MGSFGLSLNRLIKKRSAQALAAHDAEARFGALAALGDAGQALAI